jgi:uracil-DNA glycosylase family 4
VSPLESVSNAIVSCRRCDRLRQYCQAVAREKKAAHRNDEYWGKPVPGFGDPRARVLILGLAPAAHGANRTGRVFTGDGIGASGDFLMAALHRAGFANIATSRHPDDGLRLSDCYIAATVRCAPPGNKPLPQEIAACADHLDAEIVALPNLRVVVALGKIAWDAYFQHLARYGLVVRPRPTFAHGATFTPTGESAPTASSTLSTSRTPSTSRTSGTSTQGTPGTPGTIGTLILFGCYHPSRQNTNTGKVTAAMYDRLFESVKTRAGLAQ